MIEKIFVRTTKFPYIFWSFNRVYECEIDFEKKIYKNLEAKTQYKFREFSVYMFLALKYVPILIIFYFCFTIYDFNFNQRMIIAYVMASLLTLSINYLENMARKISSISILVFSLVAGYIIEDIFLVAYTIKYFLLFSVVLIFYLDLGLKPYSLMNENNKVIAHILVKRNKK